MEQMKERLQNCNRFIGVKVVRAGMIKRGQFHIDKYGAFDPVRAGGDPDDWGFAVLYEDGYISWCPAKTFSDAYREIDDECFAFGMAIEAMRKGFRVARRGWNGKNMFLFYNPGSNVKVQEGRPLAAAFLAGTPVNCRPYIMMKTADEQLTIVPWLASQTDMLADDWFIVE